MKLTAAKNSNPTAKFFLTRNMDKKSQNRLPVFFLFLVCPAHGGFAFFGLKIHMEAFMITGFTIVVISVVTCLVFRKLLSILNFPAFRTSFSHDILLFLWSGRRDLTPRPQRPERCALAELRYSPRISITRRLAASARSGARGGVKVL